jgi:transposase
MDMSVAYRGAVSTHLPKAKIVFDHFHVIKLFNDKLSELADRPSNVRNLNLGPAQK